MYANTERSDPLAKNKARSSDEIGDVLDFGHLIIMSEDDGIELFLEREDFAGERHVRLGNRYYVLCEPAGPAKLHPGLSDMSGSYEYVRIEPLAGR